MKNMIGIFGQTDPVCFTCSVFIKKADFNSFGVGRKNGEIDPGIVIRSSEIIGVSFL